VKVLLLNQTFYPDVASTAQHAADLATGLVARGHEVTVVCSRKAYDNAGQRYAKNEIWRGVRIRRISSFGFGKKARWRRAADFGSYLLNCALHLAALPDYDLVIAMTSPPLISSLGALFTAIKGGRFVFWVMDLNPDEALAAGWLRAGSWSTKALQALLMYGLRRSSVIVALDRFMAKRIGDKGIRSERMAIIPPWSHDHVVRYDDEGRRQFRSEHGLTDKFVVMYSGNHSPCHPLTTLLEAAQRLRDERRIVFCFVGGGSEFETVRRFAASRHLDNIVTIPYQPLDRLSASLSSADLHAVVMGDPFVGIVHPCKVYNVRTLCIPVLYIGPSKSHISEMNPAFSSRHGDVDAVVRHVQAAAERGCFRTAEVETVAHGQEQLVTQMIVVLERAARPSANFEAEIVRAWSAPASRDRQAR
jgi:colanic acid biosynthesis glycosyl transferase WcaI